MRVHWRFAFWQNGTYSQTFTVPLDWRKRYVIIGSTTFKKGDEMAHLYIQTLCNYNGSGPILCGIRDIGVDEDYTLGLNEFISSAIRATVKFKTKGGFHRAEGIVIEL